MGDYRCHQLAQSLQARVECLPQITNQIEFLHAQKHPTRVYYKKISDKTMEFIKSLPYIVRIHCNGKEEG